MSIGSEIRRRREALDWSIGRLAAETGGTVHLQTVYRVESGATARPHLSTVRNLERALLREELRRSVKKGEST